MTRSAPSAVDARLLAALESAFAEHAHGEAGIDVKRLQAAIGLRSEYLAKRVLSYFDTNGDGLVDRAEFLVAVRGVMFGTDREKLFFAFRLHDHDDDGTISEAELFRMIAMSLAESDVAGKASQPPERLARALFQAADENGDGKISFDEFESIVRSHPALLEKMVRSEAQWIAPNEDLLAGIDRRRPRFGGRVRRFFENHFREALWVSLFAVLNLGIFASVMLGGGTGPWQDQSMLFGHATGLCMDADGALILLPVMRRLLTRVRASFFGRVVPVDEAVTFHRVVGHTLFFMALAHGGAFVLAYLNGHAASGVGRLFTGTLRGATGASLLLVFAIMWVFSLGVIRRSRRFELFYFTHLLYVVWLVLAIAHAPSFAVFAGVPVALFAVEQGVRLRRRGKATRVVSVEALRSGVTRLEVEKPTSFPFSPGDYVFLRVPSIARGEWHPFTVSSAPERDTLTFHVRSLGNWTGALRRMAEAHGGRPGGVVKVAYLDGPYGSPSAHIFAARNAVFIGAGIGVTPFASVLESLVLRANGDGARASKLERAYFFWLNRDQYSFEWFRDLLGELENADHRMLLEMHLYMTGARTGATDMGLELAREVLHGAGRSDLITGLRTHTHLGHPDFEAVLGDIAKKHQPARVDVFFCGPPGLARKVRKICEELHMAFREERF
jgi:predicted ferric reductase/Ca2+-binding EF-hand superfamily protein